MTLPAGAIDAGVAPRAELVICLPADWPVPDEQYGTTASWTEEAYTPISWLKRLARLPRDYGSWLGFGHTIPNGDPADPLLPGSALTGWVLLPPLTFPEETRSIDTPGGRVDLFAITGITSDEMDRKVANGVESLFDGFDAHGVNEIFDPTRGSSLG